jgi:hypothetical protein
MKYLVAVVNFSALLKSVFLCSPLKFRYSTQPRLLASCHSASQTGKLQSRESCSLYKSKTVLPTVRHYLHCKLGFAVADNLRFLSEAKHRGQLSMRCTLKSKPQLVTANS